MGSDFEGLTPYGHFWSERYVSTEAATILEKWNHAIESDVTSETWMLAE